ncbi:MAG: glycoside hydrolase family 3 N-terminal domain-containing protein [Amaricoccus sp.]
MPDRRRFLALVASSAGLAALDLSAAAAEDAELIARMTLAEKLGQLTMLSADFAATGPQVPRDLGADIRSGAVGSLFNLWGRDAVRDAQRAAVEETRLGIPLFFGLDVLHGFRTIFPIPLAEAGAFDPALWETTARHAADEAAAAGIDLTFAPMLDIARDPRWGRIAEGPGEDPYVGARFAAAKVRGFQGADLAGLATTAKHFAAYGASAAGRDYAAVDVSERALDEVYLPPFRAAVDAGTAAIMPAFTDVSGIPMTANRALLTGTLRKDWGFDGLVISDYGAVGELVRHGVAADPAEAAALALNAGVDVDMMSLAYRNALPDALDRGLVAPEAVDAAVSRVLALKRRLGLFDDPFRRCAGPGPETPRRLAARRAAARDAATRSIVLLQNRGEVLPLADRAGRIAVVGPLANAAGDMLGPWAATGRGDEAVGVLAGLRAGLPSAAIEYAEGVPVEGGTDAGIAEAAAAAARAEHVILCLGEAAWMSGEAASRARMDLPGRQAELARVVLAAGQPVVVLLFSGRPIAMPDVFAGAAAVVACWFPGSEAGNAVASLLLGETAPSAGLAATWPRDVGQVPIGYSVRPGGRPENPADHYTSKYLDLPNAPQFPFGHGLRYTEFSLAPPTVVVDGDRILVESPVGNIGARAGVATIFLFIRDLVASTARPALELRRFERMELRAGERRAVRMELGRDDLAFLGADLRPVVEPGGFEVHLGFSADPAELKSATFRFG